MSSWWINAVVVVVIATIVWKFTDRYTSGGANNGRQMAQTAASVNPATLRNKSAFIVGYTGECGKQLMRLLMETKLFKRIVFVGRRKFESDDPLYMNMEQAVVDFDDLDNNKEAFAGMDVGFCCLGTTRGKAGKDGFYKVDHDYVVNVARFAREGGTTDFHLISASGANADSYFYYNKVKGEAENDVAKMGFDKFAIYRPAFLLCERQESRALEKVFLNVVAKPISFVSPTLMSVPTVSVGKAMLWEALINAQVTQNPHLITNCMIHEYAKQFDQFDFVGKSQNDS